MVAMEKSPKITKSSWGNVRVEGESRTFKDVKLFPGGAREWDWGETGTAHRPGIQPVDVEELVHKGVEVVVLSQGRTGSLLVMPETTAYLENHGVKVHILRTRSAIELYNRLVESVSVGALIHSTC